MMETHLNYKLALITGSTQGIGLSIALCFARAGVRIAYHGLATEEQVTAVHQQLIDAGAPEARFFNADLRDIDAINEMMLALDEWGGVDILVNNAGMQITTSLDQATAQTWDSIIAVNLSAAFHTMQHSMSLMKKRGYGRVINIASVHGIVASKNKSPYVASKFGLIGLSKVAALEYAECGSRKTGGVTVNCICPGWTETVLIEPQIQERAQQHAGDRDAGIADLLSEKQPSKRISDPSEIGELALWLCSPVAHNITGTSIPIDGGWTAQ